MYSLFVDYNGEFIVILYVIIYRYFMCEIMFIF